MVPPRKPARKRPITIPGSPLVSSLYALAGGSGGVGYPAATLYSHLGQSSLFDVTAGGNGYCDGEAVGPCGEPTANETFGDIEHQLLLERAVRGAPWLRVEPGGGVSLDRVRPRREHRIPLPDLSDKRRRNSQRRGRDV